MTEPLKTKLLSFAIFKKFYLLIPLLLLINFLLRIFIWSYTNLFRFGDYSAYLGAIDKLTRGEQQYLLAGNFLYAISYIGFFFEKHFGSLDFFFIFNCLIGSLSGLVLYILVLKVTGIRMAAVLTLILQTIYTEFMVFSSVFYTPVLMIFLLSIFLLLLYFYITGDKPIIQIFSAVGILLIFLQTFFFKPELKFLPWFFLGFSLLLIKINRTVFYKISCLALSMIVVFTIFDKSKVITSSSENVISNSFVFFGHTDYGGDGGEGSFVYSANRVRYEVNLAEYMRVNNISNPTVSDFNSFQKEEMLKFITHHPAKWIKLQFTKFFRTFGVVPETTSFKILYSGLFNKRLFLTSLIVVAPIITIILLFISFFSYSAIAKLIEENTLQPRVGENGNADKLSTTVKPKLIVVNHGRKNNLKVFLYLYLLIFAYYVLATIFYGQYQERYRLPLIVLFIIPSLAYFITSFERKKFLNPFSLGIKGTLIIIFLVIWTCQAKKTMSNKQRFQNAIDSIELQVSKKI
jgi:hypothetical protein